MDSLNGSLYKERFDNLFRVANKVTACLNIGDILEIIRDEVKATIPHATEACLILMDPEAPAYSRPLHCSVKHEQINCQQCKRGSEIVRHALGEPMSFHCSIGDCGTDPVDAGSNRPRMCETALPIFDGDEPLAVLNVITERECPLQDRDLVLLSDLAELTRNTLLNAKKFSRMAREKLTLERILGHIRTFVPETVQRIVEKNPEAPELARKDVDVSVLFLDVADYTRISESITSDKVNFIIEKYFSSFLDAIYSCGGDVNETAGDGLMAIFRGECAENALNAAQAALEVRRRTAEINRELAGLFYPIVVNMGINSGIASVGMSRFVGKSGTRMTFTASGPTTNLASRIASSAIEGDILLGPDTAGRIKDRMTIFDRGFMTFKNIRQKVHVYSLVPAC
ncbi:MAG: adenylate/guanylate cyclase domain-containing protein [Thermodesulfobacteriota bacterium]